MAQAAALDAARGLYGIYSKTMSIYNLPFSMMVPLTACIIPAVSAALARRDRREAQRVSESALRVGLLLSLPMGMGLFALGGPIMGLLFPPLTSPLPARSFLCWSASIFVAPQLLGTPSSSQRMSSALLAIRRLVKIAVTTLWWASGHLSRCSGGTFVGYRQLRFGDLQDRGESFPPAS